MPHFFSRKQCHGTGMAAVLHFRADPALAAAVECAAEKERISTGEFVRRQRRRVVQAADDGPFQPAGSAKDGGLVTEVDHGQ